MVLGMMTIAAAWFDIGCVNITVSAKNPLSSLGAQRPDECDDLPARYIAAPV